MLPKLFKFLIPLLLFVNAAHSQEKLFSFNGIYNGDPKSTVTRGTKLILDRNVLILLYENKPNIVRIAIPLENETITVSLKSKQLFSKNFEAIIASTLETCTYEPGYYLQGTVEGESNSLAAISIFKDFIAGVISYKGNNYNLVIANNTNDNQSNGYIIYADKHYTGIKPACSVKDDHSSPGVSKNITNTTFVGCPVDVYFEISYSIFQNLGSVTNAINYLAILFNVEQAIYNGENILMQIREIKVWNIPDPEIGFTDRSTVLYSFEDRMNTAGFNGDIAHYITFKNIGGGVAFINILCSQFSKVGISGDMYNSNNPYPVFSYPAYIITHEMGHNLGSSHTQSCSWPGGAIDNCWPTEGGCPPGPAPVNGGTIMSYCNQTSGVNFANGFGPLPGNLIRSKVITASTGLCICNCNNMQVDVTKQDIGCGNPTGSATTVITGGTGPFTYLWSNGATSSSISGLAAGTYYVTVTGTPANCKVVKGIKILNDGNGTMVSLNPSVTSVTKCLNENYTITSTVTPAGTYNYQWYINNVSIPGATTSSLTISSATVNTAVYYLAVSGGTCAGQSANITVSFQDIATPVIAANGPTNICDGQAVILSVPVPASFLVEWRLNNIPIPGATNASYSATGPGSYTVKIYSASAANCSATSAPVSVTVKPKPDAAINTTGISFCAGGQFIITHTAVAGEIYTWYKNNVLIFGANSNELTVNAAGNYYLKVTGTNGCENSSAVIPVVVNALPDAILTPVNSITFCDGGTITFQTTALSQATYTWYNGNQQLNSSTANTLTVTQSGSYSVNVTNTLTGCVNTSAHTLVSIIPPPAIFAGNDTTVATGQPFLLNVRELTLIGVDHYEWVPSTGLNNPFISSPVAILSHDQEYTVKGIYPSGCIATDKVFIKVLKGPAIYVPSAFSPNGDAINDFLTCTAVGLKLFKYFDIYNRYGQRVFHATDLATGWDGKWKGERLPVGSYVYIAEGIDYKGKQVITKGNVTILF